MSRMPQHSNVYRALTTTFKEKLKNTLIDVIYTTLKEQRQKTTPSKEFMVKTISKEVKRLVEFLDSSLQYRSLHRDYIIIYWGTMGQQSFFTLKVKVEDIVHLKSVIEANKPLWALRAQAFPIATKIPEDDCYPNEMVWPRVGNYLEK